MHFAQGCAHVPTAQARLAELRDMGPPASKPMGALAMLGGWGGLLLY